MGEKPDRLRSLAREIDELRNSRTDVELHALLLRIGAFYDPRPEMTYTEWLGRIAERMRLRASVSGP
ncbi:contact-dependent growth inhibition system immunity protein [Mycobacterium sp. SMC-4]|uniref:contact-dependent growth inhibition system immunity protein n=1 Tax=Mycobacterium sp. SMC-4 TaxID=2857059 RepID=UPI003CFC2A30